MKGPHTFKDVGFEMGFGKPRQKNVGLENERFKPMREGPTLKPSSSKLGTCHGQHAFYLGLTKLHSESGAFEHVWPPLETRLNDSFLKLRSTYKLCKVELQ